MTGAPFQIVGGPLRRSGVECEMVTDFARLEELSDEWQRLVLEDPASGVFRHWNWVRAFFSAYAAELELRVLVVRRDDRIVGFCPLAQKGRKLEFLGALEADYNDLICEAGAAPLVLETALDTLLGRGGPDGWETLELDNLAGDSRLVSSLPLLPPRLRRHVQQLPRYPSFTIAFGNQAEVLETLLRKELPKRSERKMQKLGRVALRHIESRQEAREHLAIFFRQHIHRWAVNGVRSQFLGERRRAFYEAMVEQCDLARELRFAVLELDGRPVAYHFGLQFHGTLVWYKPAFDVDYWNFCPGDVLLRHLFRYAGESDLREFDFSVGDEPYKQRFANQSKPNCAVYVERRPGALRTRADCAVRYWAAAARRQPSVLCLYRAARDRAQRAKLTGCRELVSRLAAWYRRHVWSREEVLFFSAPAKAGAAIPGVEIAPASLSELASLALQYPREFDAARLAEFRRRVKHGESAFLGRTRDGRVALFWVSRRSEVAAEEIGADCRLPLAAPALVLSGAWTAPANAILSSELLSALASLCGGELWTWLRRRHWAQCQAIAAAGFRLQFRLSYRAVLGRFRRIAVLACAEPVQQAAAATTGTLDPGS